MKTIFIAKKLSQAGLASGMIVLLFLAGPVQSQEIAPPSEQVKAIMSQAQDLKAAGKLEEALEVLKKGRERLPQSLHLQQATFQMLFGAERYEECLNFINETFAENARTIQKACPHKQAERAGQSVP